MKIPDDSDILLNDKNSLHYRRKVFGGWIVTIMVFVNGNLSLTSTFVPDRDHEWEI